MATESNLIPLNERTKEEQRRIATEGGKASGQARRKKKMLKDCLEILLESALVDEDGELKSGAEILAATVFKKALAGDLDAFKVVRDTAGQKPVEKVMIADVEPSVIAEVEAMVNGSEDGS